MHAQYNPDESLTDQYAIHRICQAYELAKFVNLMACSCSETSSRDLIILAGDMNTSSKELPYRLVGTWFVLIDSKLVLIFLYNFPTVELTALNDCYKLGVRKKSSMSKSSTPATSPVSGKFSFPKFECSDESSDEELITCGHKDNTFTAAPIPNSTSKTGKRIDFILYKVRDSSLHNIGKLYDFITMINNEESYGKFLKMENSFLTCSSESMRISAKDVSGLSFSDHQPVVSRLVLNMETKTYEDIIRSNGSLVHNDYADESNNYLDDVVAEEEDEEGGNDTEDGKNQNASHNNSLGSTVRINLQKLGTKLRQRLSALQQQSSSLHLPYQRMNSSPLLGNIEELLAVYLEQNRPTRNYLRLVLVFLALVLFTMLSIKYFVEATSIEISLILLILVIVFLIILFLCLLTFRTEQNAIYAILNDIRKKNSFSRDGLLENE